MSRRNVRVVDNRAEIREFLTTRRARLDTPSGVDGAYSGEFAEAGLGITAQDDSIGLRRVGGDDQVVCATRGTGPADMGEQASVVSRGRLRVVKDIDGGRYRHQRPGAFGGPVGRIRHLDPDAVLGDRYRGDRKFIVVQRRAVYGAAFVGDQDIGVEDQASAHGSRTSEVTRATASAMGRPNSWSGGGTSASAERRSAPVRRWAGPISATGWLPRTMVIVSPRSTASSRSEKCRDASVAVMIFIRSLYLIIRSAAGTGVPREGCAATGRVIHVRTPPLSGRAER